MSLTGVHYLYCTYSVLAMLRCMYKTKLRSIQFWSGTGQYAFTIFVQQRIVLGNQLFFHTNLTMQHVMNGTSLFLTEAK